jgi:hypothetical protein
MKKKLLALSAIAAISTQANAFQFDTGEDWQIRWDNTVKLNVMSRLNKADDQVTERATGFWIADDADLSVDRSELGLVSTRFDILSEMDVIWKDFIGFRISGSGWYDPQYEEGENDHPSDRRATWASPSADFGDFNHEAEDLHYAGGELLDAFVFANFDIGDAAIGVRGGRHTIYWGNSLLATGAVSSIGGAMAPLDFMKALSVPGSEAKELFMPSAKLSTVVQLTDNLTLNGYYSFEHRRYRLPETGTFFSPAEGLTENTEFIVFPFPARDIDFSNPVRTGYHGRDDETEDDEWGFNVQYYFERWGLETSFIYLNYVDKNLHGLHAGTDFGRFIGASAAAGSEDAQALLAGWNATCNGFPALGIEPYPCPNAPVDQGGGAIAIGEARWLMKEDNDLWGISFAKEIAGISFGLDLVYRPDTPVAPDIGAGLARLYNYPETVAELGLISPCEEFNPAFSCIPGNDFFAFDSDNYLGALGDVYTVVFNGLGLLNAEWGLWEGGSYLFEITAVMMDDCTKDCELIDTDVNEERVVTNVAGVFSPTWYQVWPGTDLTIPMSISYTIDGEKSPFTFGGDEERGSGSIGVELLIDQKWTVRGQYNTYFGPVNAGIGGLLKDRDNLSFTVKRTF